MIKMYKDTGLPVGTLGYDIETGLLHFLAFSTGEQYLSYSQLQIPGDVTPIMSISWQRLGIDKHPQCMNYIDHTREEMIQKITDLMNEAPLIIGKNNHNFDDKHINTWRLITGINPNPDWLLQSDDVQKHLKKHFNMQSYSLEHACNVLGLPNKIKMEFSDWVDLLRYKEALVWVDESAHVRGLWADLTYDVDYDDIIKKGKIALKKFIEYNKFDVNITWKLTFKISPFVRWKFRIDAKDTNKAAPRFCTKCGYNSLIKRGFQLLVNNTRKQRYVCKKCNASIFV